MALNAQVKVDVPKSGIIKARRGDVVRVYKVLKTYRNEKGQPTNKNKLIGKIDNDTGLLIPNNAYYDFYDTNLTVDELADEKPVIEAGVDFLIHSIFSTLQISQMLKKSFDAKTKDKIQTVCSYMFSCGNIMYNIKNWCECSKISDITISSQGASSLFKDLEFENRQSFLSMWAKSLSQKEYLAYDVTSVSSYAKGIADTEWGYNRDGERLPQINIGMYLGQQSRLPAFYTTYPGSIVDKSYLPYMFANNAELGIEPNQCSFVMDKGFCTCANIDHMIKKGYKFIIGVSKTHKSVKDALDKYRSEILSSKNRLPKLVHGLKVEGRFYRANTILHIFFDEELARKQRLDLYKRVDMDANKLTQLSCLGKSDIKKYSRFHKIEQNKDGSFSFKEDSKAIDKKGRECGLFCLLTNDKELTPAQVLEIYRDKDVIEKGFDELKNHLDFSRLRTHIDQTTDGKVFCAFITLIATLHIQNTLQDLMKEKNLTKRKIITELEKIKVVRTKNGKRMINPLTRLQKDIFEPFGLSEDDFKEFVKKSIE